MFKSSKKIFAVQIFFLLVNYFFFFLLKLPIRISRFNCYKGKYFLTFLTIISFLVFLQKNNFKLNWDFPSKLIYSLIFLVSMNTIFSYIRYNDIQVTSVIRAWYPFLILLLYFPMNKIFKKRGQKEKFIKSFTVINILAMIVIFVQAFLYNTFTILFISVYEFSLSDTVALRNGNFRFTFLDTMVLLSFTVSLECLSQKSKEDKLHLFNVIFAFLYIYLVSQTRSEIIICFLMLIILVKIRYGIKSSYKGFFKVTVIFLVVFAILYYNFEAIRYKFESVSVTSINTRFYELEYYIELIKKNIIFGAGMIDPLRGTKYYEILHGKGWRYSITDVGLLGQAARLGIQIVCWYCFFLFYLLKKVKDDHKNVFFFTYILLTSVNLIVLDNQRIITIPIVLALVNSDNLSVLYFIKEIYRNNNF